MRNEDPHLFAAVESAPTHTLPPPLQQAKRSKASTCPRRAKKDKERWNGGSHYPFVSWKDNGATTANCVVFFTVLSQGTSTTDLCGHMNKLGEDQGVTKICRLSCVGAQDLD
jgi:hypothetical protein